MKIALVSDDNQTISLHFGRAENYVVISLEHEKIVDRKTLPKPGRCHSAGRRHGKNGREPDARGRGFGARAESSHQDMFENIRDCNILVTRGMGRGAYLDLQQSGVIPIITDIEDIDSAVQAILNDTIINHTEKLH
jgi:predicted Fe-Mo cluster-binding NifX family protein